MFVAGKGYVTRTGESREVGKIFYLPTQADLWSPTEKKCLGVMVWMVLISQLM